MKTLYISDIQENTKIEGIFLVKQKFLRVGKTGSPYLSIILGDKTGEITGRIWENVDELKETFNEGDIVWIQSRCILYQGYPQLHIYHVEKYNQQDIDFTEFLPSAPFDLEERFAELLDIIEKVENKYLKRLLYAFFKDEKFVESFKKSPAAKSLHHVYIGGLLQHTLNVAKLILNIVPLYKDLNKDLLLTAGILHDIGKTEELFYDRGFGYTDKGRLVGHITLGIEMLDRKLSLIEDFPDNLSTLLKHLILSHHGEYEYGSPKRPKTIEALVLYFLDNFDAKIEAMQNFISKERAKDTRWTAYHRVFDRHFYIEPLKDESQEEDLVEDNGLPVD